MKEVNYMNKWQELFLNQYYKGEMPRDKRGLRQYELLENVGDTISVKFPANDSKSSRTVTYRVTENKCDMPNGVISAVVLSWQILFWARKGYKIESNVNTEEKTA